MSTSAKSRASSRDRGDDQDDLKRSTTASTSDNTRIKHDSPQRSRLPSTELAARRRDSSPRRCRSPGYAARPAPRYDDLDDNRRRYNDDYYGHRPRDRSPTRSHSPPRRYRGDDRAYYSNYGARRWDDHDEYYYRDRGPPSRRRSRSPAQRDYYRDARPGPSKAPTARAGSTQSPRSRNVSPPPSRSQAGYGISGDVEKEVSRRVSMSGDGGRGRRIHTSASDAQDRVKRDADKSDELRPILVRRNSSTRDVERDYGQTATATAGPKGWNTRPTLAPSSTSVPIGARTAASVSHSSGLDVSAQDHSSVDPSPSVKRWLSTGPVPKLAIPGSDLGAEIRQARATRMTSYWKEFVIRAKQTHHVMCELSFSIADQEAAAQRCRIMAGPPGVDSVAMQLGIGNGV
ncbi:hypothetical protein OIO90_006235 [Microbotryomycetes sp. JL221]|nr:hypothetical protein OIO90_006235 [Microbotryomycetes sp. JL221]